MSTNVPMVFLKSPAYDNPLPLVLDDQIPTSSGGYTIWEELERLKRRTAIQFKGVSPYRLSFGGYFDAWSELFPGYWADGAAVEAAIKRLEVMATPRHGTLKPPPPLTIQSGPVPRRDLEFYIETIEWTESIWDGDLRLRQRFTLSLVQRVDVEVLLRKADRTPTKKTAKYRIEKLPKGINLKELAAIQLGDATRWREIKNAKGKSFRDYRQKAGTVIKVPHE